MDTSLLEPIAGAAPAGVDLAYDSDFERLGGEIEKLNSLAGGVTDWDLVAVESERILREKSKDLRVMSWLTAARAHREGWAGIVAGLESYAALTRTFWESLHPPRARAKARAGQVEWLCSVLARRIVALAASAADAPLVRALEPLVAELGAFFLAQLGELAPVMSPLRIAVRDKIRDLPDAPAPIVPTATPADDDSPATERPSAPPVVAPVAVPAVLVPLLDAVTLGSLDAAQAAARLHREPLLTLAHHARGVAPTRAWPYRLVRICAWLAIDERPEQEHGKTFVRAPKTSEREELIARHAAAQWDAVLTLAEEAIGAHPLWLDPHRYAALALEAKGPAYREPRATVGRELCAFLQRMGELASLAFANGTPFAAAETLDWIAREQARLAQTSTRTSSSTPADENFDAFVLDLDQRLADGAADAALGEGLMRALNMPLARDRFRARLAIAKRARAGERLDLAVILYEQLLPEVDATLQAWEPQLAAELLGSYLELLRDKVRNFDGGAADGDTTNATAAQLYRRLLTLDPHAAIRCGTPW